MMFWFLVSVLGGLLVTAYSACAGYSFGYDRGYRDSNIGEPHRDNRPCSWRRRLFDLTCGAKERDDAATD